MVLSFSFLYSQSNTLAIIDFSALGISQNDAVVLTSRLRSLLVQSSPYTIIEREEMLEILQEQDFQQTGCTTDECAVKIGKILGAQFILAGEIGKLSNYITLDVRIVNVETSRIIKSVPWDKSGGDSGDLLKEGIPYIADQIRNISGLATGSITIFTIPSGADVIIDGVRQPNQSPTIINNVSAGSHELLISRTMENYGKIEIRKEVSINPNETLSVEEDFKEYMAFGSITINPVPNNISLSISVRAAADGSRIGQDMSVSSFPKRIGNLGAGQYLISMSNDKYQHEVSVPVASGNETLIDIPLRKKGFRQRKNIGDTGYMLKPEITTETVKVMDGDDSHVWGFFIAIGGMGLTVVSEELGVIVIIIGTIMNVVPFEYSKEVRGPNEKNIKSNDRIREELKNYNKSVETQNRELRKHNDALPEPKITILNSGRVVGTYLGNPSSIQISPSKPVDPRKKIRVKIKDGYYSGNTWIPAEYDSIYVDGN